MLVSNSKSTECSRNSPYEVRSAEKKSSFPEQKSCPHDYIVAVSCGEVLKLQVTEKTFQEMYINEGMANCEKRPKQERDDIRFTHIAIPTSFYIFIIL